MKIERLIGILSILLQEKKVTAPELAQKFEVSKRTINRDIDSLSQAGIPLYTTQGNGGGISIAEGYRMDKTVLTSKDMQNILAGLRSLDSVSGNNYYGQLMEKLLPGSSDLISGRDYMLIDLSSWYKKSLAPRIELIRSAIEKRQLLKFDYVSQNSEGIRQVEPYYLVFKWSNWYLWGWSCERNDFRLFKLTRMENMVESKQQFQVRKVDIDKLPQSNFPETEVSFTALFAPEAKWRIVEEFGSQQLQEQANGWLLLKGKYSDEKSLISWLLTFGNQAKLISPQIIRQKLVQRVNQIKSLYESNSEQ